MNKRLEVENIFKILPNTISTWIGAWKGIIGLPSIFIIFYSHNVTCQC